MDIIKEIINESLLLLDLNQKKLHDLAVKMSQKLDKITDEEMGQATIDYRVIEEEIYDIYKFLLYINQYSNISELKEKLKYLYNQTTSAELFDLIGKLNIYGKPDIV